MRFDSNRLNQSLEMPIGSNLHPCECFDDHTLNSQQWENTTQHSEPMALTEEQQERIRQNRERALAIQRQRKKDPEEKERKATPPSTEKKRPLDSPHSANNKRPKVLVVDEDDENVSLEPFEEGASDLVTKSDAKKLYCLPEGTLQCCTVVEKDNPRHKSWSKMKLYHRSEVRRRARKRYGGRLGLEAERKRRQDERFANDLAKTKNIFQKK
ncbi:repair protein [Seminavis robusta]|uniref:Repair protein n=1 Tax=Seminavis robusta TaxID=568900 RepID=A0A9N8ES49_9STRA|nr:repair protein [Seminavis robusta]|eukprot:Sro1446_g273440.1 repair protein (212) ;mRNA; r:12255-12890